MPENTPDNANRRILIIDDNPEIHSDIKRILCEDKSSALDETAAALFGDSSDSGDHKFDYSIDSAYQGKEGFEKVEQAVQDGAPFAMAFVDMRMPPGWDGVETIENLWKVDPDLQVVICTAYTDYSWSEIVERLGGTDQLLILKKPFDLAEVRQLALSVTKKWNLARQANRKLEELDGLVRERTAEIELQNKKLEETHSQLLHAQKMESIGQLAAGVAHEINTPIQYIGDNTRFLQDAFKELNDTLECLETLVGMDGSDAALSDLVERLRKSAAAADVGYLREEAPQAIQQTLDGTAQVAKIVRSMKEFSHPGNEEMTSIDLNQAIESTLTVSRNEWKYVAEVVTDFDDSLDSVYCFPGDLNQVFVNLIVNAAHAIDETREENSTELGEIRVSTSRDGEWAEIRIQDNGTGMPPEIKKKIFDPFFTTKAVGKGTGQGLSIAYSVVTEKHGGTIEVESEPGRGTTFIVRVPVNGLESTQNETLKTSGAENDSRALCG